MFSPWGTKSFLNVVPGMLYTCTQQEPLAIRDPRTYAPSTVPRRLTCLHAVAEDEADDVKDKDESEDERTPPCHVDQVLGLQPRVFKVHEDLWNVGRV